MNSQSLLDVSTISNQTKNCTETFVTPFSVKLGINVGVALEYYDFVIYGLLMPFLMPLFFDPSDPVSNAIKAFSIFALGYLVRPVGGIIFGQLADRKGRKIAFTSAMILMGVATCLIGCLPTIGMLSPSFATLPVFLLLTCRIAQGLSFGAELPSAITIVSETKKESKNGLLCGFVISSTSIGAVAASGVLTAITYILPSEQISLWGWRIPFLLGGLLAFVSWHLRQNMAETNEFKDIQLGDNVYKNTPILHLIKHCRLSIFAGIGIVLVPASMIITNIFFASHLVSFYAFESSKVYSSMTCALVFSIFLIPFFGWLTDRFGFKTIFILVCILLSLVCPYLLRLPQVHSYKALLGFLVLWQCFLCAGMACVLPWLTTIFPTEIRCTGVSLCYNVAYALGAILPNIYTLFISSNGHARVITYIISGIAIFGLICTLVLIRHNNNR